MADIVLSVASKATEYVVAPVCRQCGYVIYSNSYVGKLNKELVQLENERQRVQHSVDEARNNMKQIEADVEEWMKKVETVSNNARGLLDNDVRAKKTCFCGWLPNPKERYRLGREARRTAEDVQALLVRSRFERISYKNAPPWHIEGARNLISLDTVTGSRASIFQGIMKALDDEKLKVIGVYGPGGVGKTTLLEEVEKKLRKEGRPFHMIVKAKVSQTPDLKKIQEDIACALGLKLIDVPTEEGRRDLLFKRIQNDPSENILIILDDLWEKLDLKAVGIPDGDESRGCKLLLSSRFQDVLEQKMHADRTFRLEGLNNDEAFELVEKTICWPSGRRPSVVI
ncbi:uncharacterized protein J3R85_010429 [Psidium guajava]|nr:uncharacterized protein J3R85_010429 [Psidium guajava]